MSVSEDLKRVGVDLERQRAKMQTALRYMASYYRSDLTSAGIAAVSGYTVRGLQDAFHRDIGMSPTRILAALRLEEARMILLNGLGDTTVSEVADWVNMPHKGRFSAHYRDRFGETPTDTIHSRADVG